MGLVARSLYSFMVPGKFRLGISKMVADHERSAGAHQVYLAGREGERIDHVVDDVTGQGAVEGSQVVQGGVEEGKVMKLGSIAPRLASPARPLDHLPRQVHTDHAVPGCE